jgi:excisionase family DNA binding protein
MEDKKQIGSLLTISEVAQILNVHPNTLRRWSDSGKINALRLTPRGDRRYRSKDITTFLQKYEPNKNKQEQ